LVVGLVIGVVAVVAIIGVVAASSSKPRAAAGQAPQDPGSGPSNPQVELSAEDKAELQSAFSKQNEGERIYNKYISSSGQMTISGSKEEARRELEQADALFAETSQILERLGDKYNSPMGEGKKLGRMIKGVNSALRELK
jgi:hypothetical protein